MPTKSQTATARRAQRGPERRGRRARLSRDQIARAALEIVDRDGLEGLSMPRLAETLGIGTMTIYGYFRGKEELLDAVVDAAVGGVELPPGRGEWRQHLGDVVGFAHRALTRHPALVSIRFQRPVLRPEALRFGERVIGILREAGFEPVEAAQAFRLIFTYTLGFAGLSPQGRVEDARREAAVAAAGLPPAEYPNLTSMAAEWTQAMAGEEQFDYGLERILDGLEAQLEK